MHETLKYLEINNLRGHPLMIFNFRGQFLTYLTISDFPPYLELFLKVLHC